jgi:Glycosyltransferase Family 4
LRRRVLIVVSSYQPAMIADMHRARQLAWELPKRGWDVEILAPDASYQHGSCLDQDSAPFFAPSVKQHFAPTFLSTVFRTLGFGSIGWRSILPMWHSGRRLLKRGDFDLVYFSTTQFPLFLLGPAWLRQFGVPYVLDFHDPCFNENAARPAWMKLSSKHAISRWLTKHIELLATPSAAGIVTVSQTYLDMLWRRYASKGPMWIEQGRTAVIPFGALDEDLIEASRSLPSVDESGKGPVRIIYVGAGGPIMHRCFSVLCEGLAHLRARHPQLLADVAIELYGTVFGWKEGGEKSLVELARQWNVDDIVKESPERISYRRSLELLLKSDGALILGVDEIGYMPSKLMSYALSGKPLLAAVRRESPAFEQFASNPALGQLLWFSPSAKMPLGDTASAISNFLALAKDRQGIDRRSLLIPFLASAMAQRHAALFEACLYDGA